MSKKKSKKKVEKKSEKKAEKKKDKKKQQERKEQVVIELQFEKPGWLGPHRITVFTDKDGYEAKKQEFVDKGYNCVYDQKQAEEGEYYYS
jgi:hypothetical protein